MYIQYSVFLIIRMLYGSFAFFSNTIYIIRNTQTRCQRNDIIKLKRRFNYEFIIN